MGSKPYVPGDQPLPRPTDANEDPEAHVPATGLDGMPPSNRESNPESEIENPIVAEEQEEPDVNRLGFHLARALQLGEYHPVILFGTAFSGKTSLLLSLFATLRTELRLKTSVALCDPILSTGSGIGRDLHSKARQLFEVMTQAFIEGEQIPASVLNVPFFVPVEVRPQGKPAMKLAFLESNGEWYRPEREKGKIAASERLHQDLRKEIEQFIAGFQGPITFIYLAPYTQRFVDAEKDDDRDADAIENASLAIAGIMREYDRVRLNYRAQDRHMMLVTKWDARSVRDHDRFGGIQEDRGALNGFVTMRYTQPVGELQGLKRVSDHCYINAYCSGLINEQGLLQLKYDDDVRNVVISYPIRLWSWLYTNALIAADHAVVPLFARSDRPNGFLRAWYRVLDFFSGH